MALAILPALQKDPPVGIEACRGFQGIGPSKECGGKIDERRFFGLVVKKSRHVFPEIAHQFGRSQRLGHGVE